MAVRATGGFALLRYEPGNPEFPTLPDGVIVPHVIDFGGSAGLAARAPVRTRRIFASAPANESQQFAGWQTDTTWINPAIVDFGVIPSPVQRTVSVYNARSVPMLVSSLSLPSGVTLVSPSLPLTIQPYAGVTFTLEAGTSGDDTFDEFQSFTTEFGLSTFRLIGRRVFNLENIPETPMTETLIWKTDLIRSTDGTEKAYSLTYSPMSQVDYKIKFRNDIQRMKFKNQFIAGESALVVSGQKWYEARRLLNAAQSSDLTLDVDVNSIEASWNLGGPLAVVTEDGTAYSAQLDSYQFAPDPYVENVVMLIRFDGANGATSATDLSQYANNVIFGTGPTVSTAQSVFGGSSLLLGATQTEGVDVEYHPSIDFGSDDWTIDFWFRPAANDLTSSPILCARYDDFPGPGSEWYINLFTTGIRFVTRVPNQTLTFSFGSPEEVQADTWHYLRLCRSGNNVYCFIDGVQIGATGSLVGSIDNGSAGASPQLNLTIGAYFNSGFTNAFDGYIDDFRITTGVARSVTDFTPPTVRHADVNDTYLELTLGAEFGAAAPANSFVMPSELGYVSRFPTYQTHALNLEEADYSLTFNQGGDFSNLDTDYFPTLTDNSQSPASTLPILDFCNEIQQRTKPSQINRAEDVLDSGLSNRIAFSEYPFADTVSEFQITLNNTTDVWIWRTFFHYLRGSYGEFYVPTFTNDMPGVTTAASNVFDITDQDLSLLFGDPPDPRRNAIRLLYPNGNVYYRTITQVIDNVAEEEVTISSAVEAGNPFISYLQRCRILGDTVLFEHHRIDDVSLRFRFRTVLL